MKKVMYTLFCTPAFLMSAGLYAEGESSPEMPPRDQGFWQTIMMIAIAFLFFYVILWRPEQKRRKALEEQRNALKPGDRVVAMGIFGNVVRIQDQTVILKMVDGSKIEVLKAAITETLPEEKKSEPKEIEKS